jgi:hypothetical protein
VQAGVSPKEIMEMRYVDILFWVDALVAYSEEVEAARKK